jgi:hypothetical protein
MASTRTDAFDKVKGALFGLLIAGRYFLAA